MKGGKNKMDKRRIKEKGRRKWKQFSHDKKKCHEDLRMLRKHEAGEKTKKKIINKEEKSWVKGKKLEKLKEFTKRENKNIIKNTQNNERKLMQNFHHTKAFFFVAIV